MPVNSSELRFFEYLAKEAEKNPPSKPLSEMSIEEFRSGTGLFLEFAGKAADVPYKNVTIPTRDGHNMPVRIFNPDHDDTKPVLIMYPGCAYICDLFKSNAIAFSRIAAYADTKVIIPQFRLAPESLFPIPLYDAFDAFKYIALNGKLFNVNPQKIILGGFSSGAHAVAAISNLARKEPSLKILHQILLNGNYDLLRSHHEYDDYEKEDQMITKESFDFIYKQYGLAIKDFKNPLYSAYYETNFEGFPTTTFLMGEYDAIRNDGEAYYKKLNHAGVNVERIILPGQTHNTIILREAMSDGEDPAKVIADIIKRYI